jgi:flavin reductase (DIM6/NTAB) family NADH-FMN oxidoreductase RutF
MFIVTAASAGERDGCLVGFATQASIEPPRLVVMISKANRTHRIAAASNQLVVHFLHKGNHDLAELFGSETGDETDKFLRCRWEEVAGVDPPVLPDTRGWVAGSILDRFDGGDHEGFVLSVSQARLGEDGPQLGYQAVRDISAGHPATD